MGSGRSKPQQKPAQRSMSIQFNGRDDEDSERERYSVEDDSFSRHDNEISDIQGTLNKPLEIVSNTTESVQSWEADYVDISQDFPTPQLLRKANDQYRTLNRPVPRTDGGILLPYPALQTKNQLFAAENYTKIDDIAKNAPSRLLQRPMQELVDYLISTTSNELETVRVLYVWAATQDMNSLPARPSTGQLETPGDFLRAVRDQEISYAFLLDILLKFADLRTCTINGLVKNDETDDFGEDRTLIYRQWSAVVINNSWHVIDILRKPAKEYRDESEGIKDNQVTKSNKSRQLFKCSQHNERFFLTDPEEFIYSHFPNDSSWQLLARRVTLDEFEEMVDLTPEFFGFGLQIDSCRKRLLHDSDGMAVITVQQPSRAHYWFKYRLKKAVKGESPTGWYGTTSLDRYVFMENCDGYVSCQIAFPANGRYGFDLFCKNADDKTSSAYKLICSYIAAPQRPKDGVYAFPENKRHDWGPCWELQHAGLRPLSHSESVIEVHGEVELTFDVVKPEIKVVVQVYSNKIKHNEMKRYVLCSNDEDGRLIVRAKFPEYGQYAMSLLVMQPGSKTGFINVCCYLLNVTKPADNKLPFPKVTNGQLGSTDFSSSLNVKPVSHPSSYFEAGDEGQADMTFSTAVPCNFLAEFRLQRTEKEVKELDNWVFIEEERDNARFRLRFPEKGMYSLKIYGKERQKQGTYSPLFTYLIKVNGHTSKRYPFPTRYVHWSEGCELIEPDLIGLLPSNTIIPFAVRAPGALDIGVTGSGGGWSRLKLDEEDIWRANVDTGQPGYLTLAAIFENNSKAQKALLSFQVFENMRSKTQIMKRSELHRFVINRKENADLISKESKVEMKQQTAKPEVTQRHRSLEDDRKGRREKMSDRHHNVNEEKNKNVSTKTPEPEMTKEQRINYLRIILQKAADDRDAASLRSAIDEVESLQCEHELRDEYERGKDVLAALGKVEKYKEVIVLTNRATIAEIRGYQRPPESLRRVLVATLLILGKDEGLTDTWPACQKLFTGIGQDSVLKRVLGFDARNLHPEIATRALDILSECRQTDVREACFGASVFYDWTKGVCSECLSINNATNVKAAADIRRQRELLDVWKTSSLSATNSGRDSSPRQQLR